MPLLRDKFYGCLLGAVIGDIAGAPVEAESPAYISSTFGSVLEILSLDSVPEFTGPDWKVGRFTDDTQMMLCVAEWLLNDPLLSPQGLLMRFAKAFEPWRRYGTGTEAILRLIPGYENQWFELATMSFPHGSYGNGSAMRVAPVAMACFRDLTNLARIATASSRPTHSHPLAYQGAILQATAVALALSTDDFTPSYFFQPLRRQLSRFDDVMQDTAAFATALEKIEVGLTRGASCREMAAILGTGVVASETVPMALYCFLRHPDSYANVIHDAVFIGGDTDTIACMAGAISGAFLGDAAIPPQWSIRISEERWTVQSLRDLAGQLYDRFGDGPV